MDKVRKPSNSVSETSDINSIWTWLIAREDFVMYCRRENFKPYTEDNFKVTDNELGTGLKWHRNKYSGVAALKSRFLLFPFCWVT
jgi:hypothetical protein